MKSAFISDLDGTVIYSGGRANPDMIKVENMEYYSTYMNADFYKNMERYNKEIPFVPLTTRSMEEYSRIHFSIAPEYAMVGNGAVLLHNGELVPEWHQKSLELIAESKEEMQAVYNLCSENRIKLEINSLRFVESAFLFIKSQSGEDTVKFIKEHVNLRTTSLYWHRAKCYLIPRNLEKGTALLRFKEQFGIDFVMAAGDSDIDTSALNAADMIVPCEYLKNNGNYVKWKGEKE